MNDRDCDNCAHHSEGGCSVWECSFEPIEDDLISRQAAVNAVNDLTKWYCETYHETRPTAIAVIDALRQLPSAQPEYEPVKTEDFAKTMSENTLYSFMAWYGEALELMGRQGFVICKKTMR